MDIYLKRRRWKILLLSIAVVIGVVSISYTNWLTNKMAQEERNKVVVWAEATKHFSNTAIVQRNEEGTAISDEKKIEEASPEMADLETNYLTFLSLIISQNTTIPVIFVASDTITILSSANINYKEQRKDEILRKELKKMKDYSDPIFLDMLEDEFHFLYYRESNLLRNLRLYPFVQLIVIIIFIAVSYFAFNATQRAEQNQVWVGMSKETAHQLGTPISSLMAWIEILKLKKVDPQLIKEFEKDTQRLERITERFSKIGSKPELIRLNITEVLLSSVNYLKTRSSSKVVFESIFPEDENIKVPLNAALFSWVIENLCKNAIDAMGNDGKITIKLKNNTEQVFIDICDTGNGIVKSQFNTIFQPGFSTKKRGWGLGLSLAKRIIEIYHNGKIFIKSSEIGKGTTFRLVLNK